MLPDIYHYLDYRQFLMDVFCWLKFTGKLKSLRDFARLADSSSPNFLQRVKDRKVSISPAEVTKLARALHLPVRKRLYFEALVCFDLAKSHEEKEWWFLQLLHAREYSGVKQLDAAQYSYFADWYVPVVRELLTHPDYTGEPAWIAKRIIPAVPTPKVVKAIRLLRALGMVHIDAATRRFAQTEKSVRTPSEVASLAVARYHRDTIGLARAALDTIPSDKRDIRSVTLGVSAADYAVLKDRMESFWKELLAYGTRQDRVEKVFQVNMQLFPMSKD
jgi:uncharacterized protein (TIGR02147 family)